MGRMIGVAAVAPQATSVDVRSTDGRNVVASIYSNAYPANPIDTFRREWSAASQTTAAISGDNALVYGNPDFAGVEFTVANAIDASASTYIHFDGGVAHEMPVCARSHECAGEATRLLLLRLQARRRLRARGRGCGALELRRVRARRGPARLWPTGPSPTRAARVRSWRPSRWRRRAIRPRSSR